MSWHPEPLLREGRTIRIWPPPWMLFFLWLAAAAALAQPTESVYRLGPGDRIIIKVFGEEDLSMDFRLNDSGRLNYPFLGELVVQGLTVAELEQRITRGLRDSYLRDPAVTVSIAEYRPFFLYGEVQKPGGIPYQPRLTVERAIALGGGFTERASRSKIEVVRASDPKHKAVRVELSDPVFPGDVITVKQSFF
jgi:protein involved in polysaccharide export with SLBB domain